MSNELHVINSITDKCVNNGGKDIGGNTLSDSPKAPQVEVGGASEVGDMI